MKPSDTGRLLSFPSSPAKMPTTTLTRTHKRGPYKQPQGSAGGDISENRHERIRDLRAAGWTYKAISLATGYTRRHVIRICKT